MLEASKRHRARVPTQRARVGSIFSKQGDAYGIAFVGESLASVLVETGSPKEAEPVIEQAAAAFVKIGKPDDAAALRALLQPAPSKSP